MQLLLDGQNYRIILPGQLNQSNGEERVSENKNNVTDFPAKLEILEEYIPQELKDKKKWLVWRWEKRGDKYTKPPFRIDGQRSDGAVNPNDWATFKEVMEVAAKYSGIGFVLNDEDNIVAWDLDHCINVKTGELQDWAQSLITQLNSYTEVTPSGDGLRVFMFGDVPKDGTAKKHLKSPDNQNRGAIECYKNKRYTTVTGNHFPLAPKSIREVGDADVIWKSIFEAKTAELRSLFKSPKAKKLFEGDWKEEFGSQSEADLSLCRALADITDGDEVAIDKLFKQSKLYRDKWDKVHVGGLTYGQSTIQKALLYYQKIQPLTDLGDAKRFAKIINDTARYCNGRWYLWDGKRLVEDVQEAIYTKVDELIQAVVDEAKVCEFEDRKKKLISHVKTLQSRSKIENVIKLARSREPIPITVDELDTNPLAFNCMNGIVFKGELRNHSFNEMMTKISPVAYDSKASAPIWERFLADVIGDEEMIQYLARCVGYSMTGLTTEQVIFFLYGLGANGKSTFINTVMAVLGDYAAMLPTEVLMVGKDQHPTALADLRGIRMTVATEVPEGKRFNEELIKQLTGGERLKARRMHQDFFEFEPKVKLWVMGNHKPSIRGTDFGIRRRFQLIPFTRTIPKEKQDRSLLQKLRGEYEGIFNWCVSGYLDWLERGLDVPKKVLDATEEYFDDMDIVQQFLNEECEMKLDYNVPHKDLYDHYVNIMKQRNEYVMTNRQFSTKITEKGFSKYKGNGNYTHWKGLRLKNEQKAISDSM